MEPAKLALASLATLATGIVLGLAANPQLRTFPETDWRARYRLASQPTDPAPQPGVSYYGDGSTAWLFGAGPSYLSRAWGRPEPLPPLRIPIYRDDPPPPEPDMLPDSGLAAMDADGQAERTAAQAVVADALRRSASATTQDVAEPADGAPGNVQPNAPPDRSDENSATQSRPTDPT